MHRSYDAQLKKPYQTHCIGHNAVTLHRALHQVYVRAFDQILKMNFPALHITVD